VLTFLKCNQFVVHTAHVTYDIRTVGGREVSAIGRGLCVLLGIARADTFREAEWM